MDAATAAMYALATSAQGGITTLNIGWSPT
ncbi:hypothetical protein BKA23_3160 [Rudaeicoccus suwonensis]|uniref:Uncharacterized protein n=1 Tax=Rudaeicoccus suwonensis TaxID=657409 RepID=A0A561E1H6_9MICO|nr:hypothetical protein BKA23_3160 [Rudaeicoccus suwonensis]